MKTRSFAVKLLLLMLLSGTTFGVQAKSLAERYVEEADMMPIVQSGSTAAIPRGFQKLTVEQTECAWQGSEYVYSINVNGTVKFEGEPASIHIPRFSASGRRLEGKRFEGISNDSLALRTLFNFLASSGVHTFSANFDSRVADQCETFLSVTHDDGTNLIRMYGPDVPVQLDVLLLLSKVIVRSASY